MSFIKIWIHAVWATKNRAPFLVDDIRDKIFAHIKEESFLKGIYIDTINGHVDHAHCLISLGGDQSVSKVIKIIKGESSFWINRNKITQSKFYWQDDFFAASVSDSIVPRVRRYIINQPSHHKIKPFQEEFDEFIQKHGFKKF